MASTGREKNAEHVYTMKTVGRRLLARARAVDDERGVAVDAESHGVYLEQCQIFKFLRKVENSQFFPPSTPVLRVALGKPGEIAKCRLQSVTAALWRFTGFEDETGLELPDFITPRDHPLRYEVSLWFEPNVLVLEDTRMICKPDRRRKQQALYMQDDPDPIELWNRGVARNATLLDATVNETAIIHEAPDDLIVIRKGFPLSQQED